MGESIRRKGSWSTPTDQLGGGKRERRMLVTSCVIPQSAMIACRTTAEITLFLTSPTQRTVANIVHDGWQEWLPFGGSRWYVQGNHQNFVDPPVRVRI